MQSEAQYWFLKWKEEFYKNLDNINENRELKKKLRWKDVLLVILCFLSLLQQSFIISAF